MPLFVLLFAVTFALTLWGRRKYQTVYDEELKNLAASGITGAELARRILDVSEIGGVEIVKGHGLFSDFYDPLRKRLVLTPQHFNGSTFTALGIAAHEAGHVLQHRAGHVPLHWRVAAIRATIWLSLPLVFAGVFTMVLPVFGKSGVYLALAGWSLVAAWNLVTLPVELDASERAREVLERNHAFRNLDERIGIARVMRAAGAAHIDGVFSVLSWLGTLVFGLLPTKQG
ncbi:MAG: zinc metallopeptidase [Verrucomicrobiae bacterium]|nr:zinc metallopeptidase [Verrucomicrobiae bacterium]MCP5542060.1 zinc metallopeptidase [Akkermansiaceae bacterium]MCP5551038.1 zinc metallopeptidase [Akkermansiaceae bacterium]